MKQTEQPPAWQDMLRALLVGLIGAVLSAVLCLFLTALLMTATALPSFAVTALSILSVAVGAFVGGFLSARLSRKNGWLMGLACGGILTAALLIAEWMIGDSVHIGMFLLKMAILAVGGMVGGVIGVNRK